jgi:hypothetical protein
LPGGAGGDAGPKKEKKVETDTQTELEGDSDKKEQNPFITDACP